MMSNKRAISIKLASFIEMTVDEGNYLDYKLTNIIACASDNEAENGLKSSILNRDLNLANLYIQEKFHDTFRKTYQNSLEQGIFFRRQWVTGWHFDLRSG